MNFSRRVALTLCHLAVGLMLLTPSSASAATLGLDFVGSLENAFSADLTFGWSFSVNQSIAVSGLGFFDDFSIGGPGLKQDHLVSLWTSGGALLAQTTITNASTPVASTAADGQWLFSNIAVLVLAPGNYVIGAHNAASVACATCDYFRFLDTATVNPAITFIEALDGAGNAFPTSPVASRNDGYFGPNLAFDPVTVPEPSSLLLLGTGGLALIAKMRSRKKAQNS